MTKVYLLLASVCLTIFACDDKPQESNPTTSETTSEKVDSTLQRLNNQIETDPNNYKNYLDRAQYLASTQNYVDAMKDVDRAFVIDSTKADIYLIKGNIHFDLQKEKEAYKDYEDCLRFDANNTDCLLKKASIDILLKNYSLAITHINDALKINETLPYAYYLKGRLYKATGDTTLACSSYQTAVEVDPTYYDAYVEVGLLYYEKKHDLAKEYFQSAIELNPHLVEPWYNLAMFYQETGFRNKDNYSKAFACYDSIISIEPKFAAAYFNKGYINLEYLQNYQEGINQFTKAIDYFPNYFQAYYNRGLCYESLDQPKMAEQDYRASLRINPQYTEAAKSLSRILGENR
ncbi:MAG: tetratricopeptide repeat protein [Flavobacteriales bacterium]